MFEKTSYDSSLNSEVYVDVGVAITACLTSQLAGVVLAQTDATQHLLPLLEVGLAVYVLLLLLGTHGTKRP